jgi:hypothetical protein
MELLQRRSSGTTHAAAQQHIDPVRLGIKRPTAECYNTATSIGICPVTSAAAQLRLSLSHPLHTPLSWPAGLLPYICHRSGKSATVE